MRRLALPIAKIIAHYNAGKTVDEIVLLLGLTASRDAVYRRLRAVGIGMRPSHQRRGVGIRSRFKHGHSYGVGGREKATPEYHSWTAAKARCYKPTNNRYYRYGALGVVVCAGLRTSFEHFLQVLGLKPEPKSEYSVDRFPIRQGNYTCGICEQCVAEHWDRNVRWATRTQQVLGRAPFKQPVRRKDVPTESIIHLYVDQGKSMPEVHALLGLSIPSISRRLHSAGVEVRALGTNQFSVIKVPKKLISVGRKSTQRKTA